MQNKATNSIDEKAERLFRCKKKLLPIAERELAAFRSAIAELYGSRTARMAAEIWMELLEAMDWPADGADPDWRPLTIAAAALVAARITSLPALA